MRGGVGGGDAWCVVAAVCGGVGGGDVSCMGAKMCGGGGVWFVVAVVCGAGTMARDTVMRNGGVVWWQWCVAVVVCGAWWWLPSDVFVWVLRWSWSSDLYVVTDMRMKKKDSELCPSKTLFNELFLFFSLRLDISFSFLRLSCSLSYTPSAN